MSARAFEGEKDPKRATENQTKCFAYVRRKQMTTQHVKNVSEGEELFKAVFGFRFLYKTVDISEDYEFQKKVKRRGAKTGEFPIFYVENRQIGNINELRAWVEIEKKNQVPTWVGPGGNIVAKGAAKQTALSFHDLNAGQNGISIKELVSKIEKREFKGNTPPTKGSLTHTKSKKIKELTEKIETRQFSGNTPQKSMQSAEGSDWSEHEVRVLRDLLKTKSLQSIQKKLLEITS
eukprot:TRINITY_DN12001_c0_g1_i1.p1 TRINITY_DN12001_c0_g1~~TRINITY_DN12001_c0_g1_i1.p1  ORF type:complete len:234 (+),score=57.85 TRINITY_DN12001_c0_g1_i1:83-784(+)